MFEIAFFCFALVYDSFQISCLTTETLQKFYASYHFPIQNAIFQKFLKWNFCML